MSNTVMSNGGIPPNPTTQIVQQIIQARNGALSATDWTQLPPGTIPDAPVLTPEKQQAYAVYRQQLRDFPPTIDISKLTSYYPLLFGASWPKQP